jgi:hypothetical protein
MKKLITICAVCLVVGMILAVTPAAWGVPVPFNNPPENNPNITWETQSPYQRNIMMDFGVNPVGPVGPIPGADYEGYDDPDLWDSDFVTMTGAVQWNEAKGGIGIFGGGSGTITFHFDNWERPWPVKHFYEELVLKIEAAGSFNQDFFTPSGKNTYTDSWNNVQNLGGGSYRFSLWAEFQPNPPWEEKVFTISTNGNIYLDSLHVATECIPEPATIGILGLGALSLLRRKK